MSFQKLVIEGKTYFLVPQEFIESLVANNDPALSQPTITTHPQSAPLPTTATPPTTDASLLSGFQPTTDPQTGNIPVAQGKPSEYRQKFKEKRLGPYDVSVQNTANLSSLKPRQSKFDAEGKEQSFEEVIY